MTNKVFRRDDDLAVILHSNTKQTTLKNVIQETDLIEQLKRQGYSEQAIQEILKWYSEKHCELRQLNSEVKKMENKKRCGLCKWAIIIEHGQWYCNKNGHNIDVSDSCKDFEPGRLKTK